MNEEGCGNGVRCFARFLKDLGVPGPYQISVHDRLVEAQCEGNLVRVAMGEPRDLRLHLDTEHGPVHFVDTGVPHAVLFVPDAEGTPLDSLGPFLRHHPLFQPRGANGNLAQLCPDGTIRLRTFERGVEGETLACGTGACAAAVIAAQVYGLPSPLKICCTGGDLEIRWDGRKIFMAGPAKRVFEGSLLLA